MEIPEIQISGISGNIEFLYYVCLLADMFDVYECITKASITVCVTVYMSVSDCKSLYVCMYVSRLA